MLSPRTGPFSATPSLELGRTQSAITRNDVLLFTESRSFLDLLEMRSWLGVEASCPNTHCLVPSDVLLFESMKAVGLRLYKLLCQIID